ncbi:MAG: hypothetical protein C4551_10815 [Bacillota bacterium]|nr:MAG: hypothetical protein C4551_10815 [Bacillota bacterium]
MKRESKAQEDRQGGYTITFKVAGKQPLTLTAEEFARRVRRLQGMTREELRRLLDLAKEVPATKD